MFMIQTRWVIVIFRSLFLFTICKNCANCDGAHESVLCVPLYTFLKSNTKIHGQICFNYTVFCFCFVFNWWMEKKSATDSLTWAKSTSHHSQAIALENANFIKAAKRCKILCSNRTILCSLPIHVLVHVRTQHFLSTHFFLFVAL